MTFTPLGDLPGGAFGSGANDVSADGRTVVGASESTLGFEAFIWRRDSSMRGLGYLQGGYESSRAIAASADGCVVVGTSFKAELGQGDQAFRWTSASGMQALPKPAGGASINVEDVSADGGTVVGWAVVNLATNEAWRWTSAGGTQWLSVPSGIHTRAKGVSADGSVIVGDWNQSRGERGQLFRWTAEEGFVNLDSPPSDFDATASVVSGDGNTIFGTWRSNDHTPSPFRRTTAAFVRLSMPAGIVLHNLYDASYDGSRLVGSVGEGASREAVIWDNENRVATIKSILASGGVNLAGWQRLYASGISADGNVIVGGGINPMGFPEAWIAAGFNPKPQLALTRVNDQVQLTLTGKRGSRYAIEISTDLVNWSSPLTVTVTEPSGTIAFPAPGESSDPRRFYRATPQ